jgi:hypothetical protein
MTETQRNPEQDVLDEIDQLVDETMTRGRYRDGDDVDSPRCSVCKGGWHGLRADGLNSGMTGCPGEFGTDDEKAEWKRDYEERKRARLVGGGGIPKASASLVSIPVPPQPYAWRACVYDAGMNLLAEIEPDEDGNVTITQETLEAGRVLLAAPMDAEVPVVDGFSVMANPSYGERLPDSDYLSTAEGWVDIGYIDEDGLQESVTADDVALAWPDLPPT